MSLKNLTIFILAALLIGAGAIANYFYQQTRVLSQNPTTAAQQQVTSIVAEVGKLIVLPEGETPTVATVSDPNELKNQPFFANAKAGDIVLIYTNAKEAFLYDPTENKIVDVAPLNVGGATSSQGVSASTTTQ